MAETVLIISLFNDVHAHSARWALARRGIETDLFVASDFPQRASGTVSLERGFELTGPSLGNGPYGVVWNRKSANVVVSDALHDLDRDLAEKTGRIFLRAYADCQAGVPWINAADAAERIERKVAQLFVARQAGFRVPETIMSNDSANIRSFLRASGSTIVKAFRPMSWKLASHDVALTTSRITLADVEDRVAVESCPMIYQREIAKRVEYRVVVFGGEIICFEIDSQSTAGAELDWRVVHASRLRIRQIPCPHEITEGIRVFMQAAGLVHGSFDFIRGVDGELYFLEINQQGQYLWLEAAVPTSLLLDRTAAFLASCGDPSFSYVRPDDPATFADYVETGRLDDDLHEAGNRHLVANYETRIAEEGAEEGADEMVEADGGR